MGGCFEQAREMTVTRQLKFEYLHGIRKSKVPSLVNEWLKKPFELSELLASLKIHQPPKAQVRGNYKAPLEPISTKAPYAEYLVAKCSGFAFAHPGSFS